MVEKKPSESAMTAINEIAETYWAEYDFCSDLLQHCANIIDKHGPPEERVIEGLSTACYLAKGFVFVVCRDRNQDPNETDIYQSICAALTEYEKAQP